MEMKQHVELARKAHDLATLANDYLGLIQSGELTEALGLLRVIARLRIDLEALNDKAAYDDNISKESGA